MVDAVDELARIGPGDVLVFFPGEREIRDAAAALRGHHPPHTEILPLFARLSADEQERVFKPSNARRIVLATNVAETSLTVPGIRYVVDTGIARVKRYSYRNKVEQLRTESDQPRRREPAGGALRARRGRRLHPSLRRGGLRGAAGVHRSGDPAVVAGRRDPADEDAAASATIEAFPFIEPPLPRAITDGYQLLNELGAVDDAARADADRPRTRTPAARSAHRRG